MSDYQDEGTPQTKAWVKKNDRLKGERAVWETMWQEIAEHVFPRKAGVTQKDYTPNNQRDAYLYDITAQDSLSRAVAGYMTWTTDKSQPWFEFTPTLQHRQSEPVKNWLRECSMLGAEYVANSNFYAERHESLFDKWGFGTDCLFSQVTPDKTTRFEKIRIGTYVFWTDWMGRAEGLIREFELTASQAEGQFGRENLPKCVTEVLENDTGKKFTFLHIVEPRDAKDRGDGMGYNVAKKKAFLSAYVEKTSCKIVQEGGFDSFPFTVGRFSKWDALANSSDWGFGPGFSLLPESRQLNFMAKMMDVYSEKSVFPPLMVPDTFEGTLKTGARATNYYPAGVGADSIYPLQVTGDWSVAMDRMKQRQEIIKRVCHLDMFQMFAMNSANNREMTAYEASQLAGEKLEAISPAFDRDSTESISPHVIRCFEGWAENGMLPPPPEESIVQVGPNLIQVPNPTVTMTNRLALALRALSMRSADNHIQSVLSIAAVVPDIVDTVNFDFYSSERARLAGCDPHLLRPLEEVAQMRQARAQAQQAQQAAMMAKDMGAAVNSAGGIDKVRELVGG